MKTAYTNHLHNKAEFENVIKWKADIAQIDAEIRFTKQLLSSYMFEPRTEILFEKSLKFQRKLREITTDLEEIKRNIKRYEKASNPFFLCEKTFLYNAPTGQFSALKSRFLNIYSTFYKLKEEVLTYMRGVLNQNYKTV